MPLLQNFCLMFSRGVFGIFFSVSILVRTEIATQLLDVDDRRIMLLAHVDLERLGARQVTFAVFAELPL